MQLISKFNKRFRFLLCVIDIFSKYAWVVPLQYKKRISIVNAFQKILDKSMELHSERKPKKYGLIKEMNFTIIFKVGDHVRISIDKNIFAKGYMPNSSEEVFFISKVKNTVPWTYVINDVNGEEIIGTFYEKELQKTNQKEFRIEKVHRKKGDKLYIKWKGYDNSFNSWIDQKT